MIELHPRRRGRIGKHHRGVEPVYVGQRGGGKPSSAARLAIAFGSIAPSSIV
jgi:hypothetical protein